MIRILIALMLAIFGAFAAPALAQDKTYANARDAYLDGWFEETAQRDFEKALAAYRACVAKGDDRELAAKALLRIAMIARAMGDEDAAKAQLAQLAETYADTAAGKKAGEAEVAATTPSGADATIAEAKRKLEEMFTTPDSTTNAKVEEVFQVLDAKDFIEARKRVGGDATRVLSRLARLKRADLLAEIALSTDTAYTRDVLSILVSTSAVPQVMYDVQFGGALLPLLERPEVLKFSLGHLLCLFASQRDAATLSRLAEQVRASEPHVGRNLMATLDANESPEVDMVVDAVIDVTADAAANGKSVNSIPYSPTEPNKPSSRRALARYASLPPVLREQLAYCVAEARDNGKPVSIGTDPLFQQTLVDPEPRIRRVGIERMIADPDPSVAADGIRRMFAEAPPWSVQSISNRQPGSLPPIALEALLGVPRGAPREWAYWQTLSTRDVRTVLEFGLRTGDSEMLAAFFDPRGFVQNPTITWDGDTPLHTANPPSGEVNVRGALAAISDPSLLVRLSEAAARSPDLRVRRMAAAVFASLSNERPLPDAIRPFMNDAVPTVRRALAATTSRLPLDMQRVLALDASLDVGLEAIAQITDVGLIQDLARAAQADRVGMVLDLAIAADDAIAVASVLDRDDIDDGATERAFKALVVRDPSAFARLLRVASRKESAEARSSLQQDALREFKLNVQNPLSGPLWETAQNLWEQLAVEHDQATLSAAASAFDAAAPALDEVWRAAQRTQLFELAGTLAPNEKTTDPSGRQISSRIVGERLARVSDRADLEGKLIESPGSRVSQAAAWALASLGAKGGLVGLLSSVNASDDLGWLVAPLVAVGAHDELLAAAFEGRLSASRVWDELLAAGAFRSAGRLRYAPIEQHVVMQTMSQSETTLTAIAGALEAYGDVETLLRAAELDGHPIVVRALLRMGQQEALFERLPSIPRSIAHQIANTLKELTKAGLADPNGPWPKFTAQQSAQIAAWRAALETK